MNNPYTTDTACAADTSSRANNYYLTEANGVGDIPSNYSNAPAVYSGSATLAMQKAANQTYLRAEYQYFISSLKAVYTKHAIDNTSMLIGEVERCLSLSPYGEEEYRGLVKAYVYSAMQEIVGGEWQ